MKPTPAAPNDQQPQHNRTESEAITQALGSGKNKRVRKLLARMHPGKIAALLEMLDTRQRQSLWQQIESSLEGRILPHLSLELIAQLAGDANDPLPSRPQGERHGASVNHLEAVRQALALGKLKRVGKLLQRIHPAKVAGLLEALPPVELRAAWSMLETERTGKVLTYLHDEIRGALALELDLEDLIASAEQLELDDRVDLIQTLPGELGSKLLHASNAAQRQQLESMLSYPENSAGGLMNADPILVRADVKASTVLRYLRLLEKLPPQTDMLMVVDRKGHYQGALRLSELVTADLGQRVSDLMHHDIAGIAVTTSSSEVARLFQDHDLLSAPVVDEHNRLLGRITVDDVIDLIRENSDRALMHMAGLDD